MKSNNCYIHLTIQGDALTWHQVSKKRQGGNSCPSGTHKDLDESEDSETLYKKARRRRNGLLKALYSIKKEPRWFITVLYPPKDSHKISADRLKYDLDKLGSRFRYRYPDGWLLYTIEWSRKAGFHIHFLARSGERSPRMRFHIRRWWSKIVKSSSKKLVDVKHLATKNDAVIRYGYITKRSKFKGHLKVTKLLGKKWNFGIINKTNCLRVPKKIYRLSLTDFEALRGALLTDFLKDD